MFLLLKNMLITALIVPIFGILLIAVLPEKNKTTLKVIALNAACFPFLISLFVLGCFSKSRGLFQFVEYFNWMAYFQNISVNSEEIMANYNVINFIVGIDGISLFFLLLTTLLIPLCLLASWDSIQFNLKEFLIAFLMLDFFLIGTFCVLDLLLFYIFFESVLIPMFFIIGIWGSRERRILASYYFFLYTLVGSVIMFLAILYIIDVVNSSDYQVLLIFPFLKFEEKILWLCFFIGFASKVPMVPVHLWLPEAHVEAPTSGSVILAGVLLKLGIYGFIRFSLPLFPLASLYFSPLVYTIAVIGVIYTSFTAIRQTDFKRIIAYTSIAHMNLVVLGIFSFNVIGIEGAILQSLSHGFVASALFLVIGVVYDRYKTRLVQYYGGLVLVMPVYVTIFLFFTIANMSFPGTSSFVGEFLILAGIFKINATIAFLAATSVMIGGAYSLWVFNRISFGNLKTQYIKVFSDITFQEFVTFVPLILGTIVMGVYANLFLDYIHMSVSYLIELIFFSI